MANPHRLRHHAGNSVDRSTSPFPVRKSLDPHVTTTLPVGEDKTNVLRSAAVALRTCTVSFSGPSGLRHSVDVTAESVYEAAAMGVSALRKSGWADAVALGTELEIQVREPPTSHRVTLHQIHRWCDGMATSPDETLKKRKLKQLLG